MAPETIILLAVTICLLLMGHVLANRRLFTTAAALALPFWATGLFMADNNPAYEIGISSFLLFVFIYLSRKLVGEERAYYHPMMLAILELMALIGSIAQFTASVFSTYHYDIGIFVLYCAQLLILIFFGSGLLIDDLKKGKFDLAKRLASRPGYIFTSNAKWKSERK